MKVTKQTFDKIPQGRSAVRKVKQGGKGLGGTQRGVTSDGAGCHLSRAGEEIHGGALPPTCVYLR